MGNNGPGRCSRGRTLLQYLPCCPTGNADRKLILGGLSWAIESFTAVNCFLTRRAAGTVYAVSCSSLQLATGSVWVRKEKRRRRSGNARRTFVENAEGVRAIRGGRSLRTPKAFANCSPGLPQPWVNSYRKQFQRCKRWRMCAVGLYRQRFQRFSSLGFVTPKVVADSNRWAGISERLRRFASRL